MSDAPLNTLTNEQLTAFLTRLARDASWSESTCGWTPSWDWCNDVLKAVEADD